MSQESVCALASCHHTFTPAMKRRQPQVYCSPKCKNKAWTLAHPRRQEPLYCVDNAIGSEGVVLPVVVAADARQVAALRIRVAELEAAISLKPTSRLFVLKPSGPATWKHGANCYRNHGCRCGICVAGVRARDKARHR